jgi:hypothetical protein
LQEPSPQCIEIKTWRLFQLLSGDMLADPASKHRGQAAMIPEVRRIGIG